MRLTELAIDNSDNKKNKNRNDCDSDYPIGSHPVTLKSVCVAFMMVFFDMGVSTYGPSPSVSSPTYQHSLHSPKYQIWYAQWSPVADEDLRVYYARYLRFLAPFADCLVIWLNSGLNVPSQIGVVAFVQDVGHANLKVRRCTCLRTALCGHRREISVYVSGRRSRWRSYGSGH